MMADDIHTDTEQTVEGNSAESSLQQELIACKQESFQWKEQFLRTRADFENFTKRMEKERAQVSLYAENELILELLAVLDDFDRALAQEIKDNSEEYAAWRLGVQMIRTSLEKLLESYDVVAMTSYEIFNPSFHDAISQIVIEGKQSGSIVHVVQKGYMRKDTVLRPAKVVVAQ